MPTLRTIVARLFTLPSGPALERSLIPGAARAHRHLFQQELQDNAALAAALPCLGRCIGFCAGSVSHEKLCCDPTFVEGLHRLSPTCPRLRKWHRAVASPSALDVASADGADFGPLGAVELALRIRDGCQWLDRLRLTSDMFGRLSFPGSDCGLSLQSATAGCGCVLANEPIDVTTERSQLRWQWAGEDSPFLVMPQATCQRMITDNHPHASVADCTCESAVIDPVFTHAVPLCGAGARYEQIKIFDPGHAEQTAEIVRLLHRAIQHNSPAMHREFCTYLSTIRGFELQLSTPGIVQSFSDPTLPGVVGFNVPYNEHDEPMISPLCFTWLAHELAHTKFYLINDIAYDHGQTFVRNGGEMTDTIARYSRRLPIRTLFQIPYTHLYELLSLIDFLNTGFAGIPWPIVEDPIAYGDDLSLEIEEAIQLTDEVADLTPLGAAAFSRFRDLHAQTSGRWKSLAAA